MGRLKLVIVLLILSLLTGCVKANVPVTVTETDLTETPIAFVSPIITPEQTNMPLETIKPSISPSLQSTKTPDIDFTNSDWLKLDDDAKLLTEEEIEYFNNEFNTDYIQNQFLTSTYDKPENIDLYELFYCGSKINIDYPSIEEITAFLKVNGHWITETWASRISSSEMNDILMKYMNISFEQANKINLNKFYYLPDNDSYYNWHGAGNTNIHKMLYGYVEADKVYLFYDSIVSYWNIKEKCYTSDAGIFRLEMHKNNEQYLYYSNSYIKQNGESIDYITHVSQQDINRIAPIIECSKLKPDEILSADNFDDAINHVITQEKFTRSESNIDNNWIEYGIIIYGSFTVDERTKTPAIYFVFHDGSVYTLPPPLEVNKNPPSSFQVMGLKDMILYYAHPVEYSDEVYIYYSYYFIFPTTELIRTIQSINR